MVARIMSDIFEGYVTAYATGPSVEIVFGTDVFMLRPDDARNLILSLEAAIYFSENEHCTS